MTNQPLVSIGFPIYNGMRYLRQALDRVVAQDYPNLEIIISDNASTDGSYELCQEYAAAHPAIKLYRNEQNLGAAVNFKRVLDLATGTWFMWTAHDDLMESTLVSTCVRGLQEHPDAVLSFTGVRFIDADSNEIPNVRYNHLRTYGMRLQDRVKKVVDEFEWYGIYGLMPTAIAQQMKLHTVFGPDVLVLLWLSLKGPFVIAPEPLFVYRMRPKTAQDDLNGICKPGEAAVARRPYTSLARNLLQVIALANLDFETTVALKAELLSVFAQNSGGWMRVLLGENPELIKYINAQYPQGLSPLVLQALFAGLLLDRNDLPSFELGAGAVAPPAASIEPADFPFESLIDKVVSLIESGDTAAALAFYDRLKPRFEKGAEFAPFSAQMEQIRGRISAKS